MSEFVNKILTELKGNSSVNQEPLVKMVVESVEKSISLGENKEKIYHDLKINLASINEKVKNPTLGIILSQFKKNETTTDSLVQAMSNEISLKKEIASIKESSAYSNPLIRTQVDQFDQHLNLGYPSFALCENFIATFSNHKYDQTISTSISRVQKYLNENAEKVRVLWTIFEMDNAPTPIYKSISNEIKEMLISESYSADILKIKFGNSVPVITSLINDLRIFEAKQHGTFTVGEGNGDTQVNNLIAPAIKTADGILIYTDNRFLSIREAKGLTGNETMIHVDEKFKISDLSPEHVKSTYGNFYNLCESYATLGFKRSEDGLSLTATLTQGVNLSFKLNEKKSVDLYLNNEKCTSVSPIHEALVFENAKTKSKINLLFENVSNIFHLEFIKEITNDRTLSEALVLNLNESYYICDKVNAAHREWSKVNESQLTQFFSSKFNYDVTSIFKVKLDENTQTLRAIEEKKKNILIDIEKLEKTAQKLEESLNSNEIDKSDVAKLEEIKESIAKTILNLKKEYEQVDLFKKKVA